MCTCFYLSLLGQGNGMKTEAPKVRKKSLFAQQVEAHSSLQFGVEPAPHRPASAYRRQTQAGEQQDG